MINENESNVIQAKWKPENFPTSTAQVRALRTTASTPRFIFNTVPYSFSYYQNDQPTE